MIEIAFLIWGLHADPILAPEIWLQHPIKQRVREFERHKNKGYSFLKKTAFSAALPLQTRWRAITTMGRLDPVLFRAEIERSLKSPEWFMRNAGLIALLGEEHVRAVAWSARLLNDPALVVRTQAVRNLIALDAREAEGALWTALYDHRNFKGPHSLWVRPHIAEALAKFAGPGRAKAFERMLLDKDSRLHKWAVNGLEVSTGMRMSDPRDPVERRRQQWLSRLNLQI